MCCVVAQRGGFPPMDHLRLHQGLTKPTRHNILQRNQRHYQRLVHLLQHQCQCQLPGHQALWDMRQHILHLTQLERQLICQLVLPQWLWGVEWQA